MAIKNLPDAIAAIDADIAKLTETAIALGTEVFTSVEEYEPDAFWKVRKVFIELAKAREIRGTLTAENGDPVEAPKRRRRGKAAA